MGHAPWGVAYTGKTREALTIQTTSVPTRPEHP